MKIIKKEKNNILCLNTVELKYDYLNKISKTGFKILKLLKEPKSLSMLARELKINDQLCYYHIKKLLKTNLIEISYSEKKAGFIVKYYKLKKPSFFVALDDFKENKGIIEKSESEFLKPFIEDGNFNAKIIVGSPDPHGPLMARSRDGYFALDLCLFLGTFLNYVPSLNVKLDTETNENDLRNNLIIIGGPIVNSITLKINKKLPIFFDEKNNWSIFSKLSNQRYYSEETGIIIKTKNPFDSNKKILLIAGLRNSGTRSSVLAFLKYYKELTKPNKHKANIFARVVEGVDKDSDGIVDDVVFKE